MFTLKWSVRATAEYDRLCRAAAKSHGTRKRTGKQKTSKPEGLFKQVDKTLRLLRANPRHPGLQTHAYESLENPFDTSQKVFEAYAQHKTPGAYRVFWCYGPKPRQITIIAITPHP